MKSKEIFKSISNQLKDQLPFCQHYEWWNEVVVDNWDVAVAKNESGTVVAIWPYSFRKKGPWKMLCQPAFTPYGGPIFIYPEGTRNYKDDFLLPFHRGAFKMAIESGRPIAVQTIVGIENIAPSKGFEMRPGKVKIVWNEPISVEGMTEVDIPRLTQMVREVMIENLRAEKLGKVQGWA